MEQTSTPNREQAPTSGRETQKSEDAEVVGVPLSPEPCSTLCFGGILAVAHSDICRGHGHVDYTAEYNSRKCSLHGVRARAVYYRRHTHGNAVDAATIGTHHRC